MGPAKIRPTTKENHIGIEIEFDRPTHDTDKDKFINKFNKYKEFVDVRWEHITYADTNQYGYEAAILCTENDYKEKLLKVLKIIKLSGSYVDKRCGLHVHIDCRNRNIQQVYRLFSNNLETLWTKVDAGRKTDPNVGEFRGSPILYGRNNYNTVEVRIHQGTLDHKEICKWVKTLLDIVNTIDQVKVAA